MISLFQVCRLKRIRTSWQTIRTASRGVQTSYFKVIHQGAGGPRACTRDSTFTALNLLRQIWGERDDGSSPPSGDLAILSVAGAGGLIGQQLAHFHSGQREHIQAGKMSKLCATKDSSVFMTPRSNGHGCFCASRMACMPRYIACRASSAMLAICLPYSVATLPFSLSFSHAYHEAVAAHCAPRAARAALLAGRWCLHGPRRPDHGALLCACLSDRPGFRDPAVLHGTR